MGTTMSAMSAVARPVMITAMKTTIIEYARMVSMDVSGGAVALGDF